LAGNKYEGVSGREAKQWQPVENDFEPLVKWKML